MKRCDPTRVLAYAATVFCGFFQGEVIGAPSAPPLPMPDPAAESHPPIAIPFTLQAAGLVTLVIEDAGGKRVRNLIAETPFPAGRNTAWWDGLDDLGRDNDAAAHAIYHIPGKLVPAGTYRVRGLVRPDLHLFYEMTPYTNGNPPWATADKSSEWLANHTPPAAVLFVPAGVAPARAGKPSSSGGQILVGSHVSEGGSGLAWLDTAGHKLNGQVWVGGVWTGASNLARDEGDHPVPNVYAYTGAGWKGDKYNKNIPELRLHELVRPGVKTTAPKDTRMGSGEDPPVLTPNYRLDGKAPGADGEPLKEGPSNPLGGLAVYNGLLVASVATTNNLLFVDAAAHKTLGTAPLSSPRGLAFDHQGRLLVLSGTRLLRYQLATDPTHLAEPTTMVTGLEDPQQLALDRSDDIYISDWGNAHQVKVFDPHGKPLRTIGQAGKPAVGPYNPAKMHFPAGLTIDDHDQLWVAESDKAPKRLSVWNLDGTFVRGFYGPQAYGGGGSLDSQDQNVFFYADDGGGQQLALDRAKGSSVPVAVYWRADVDTLGLSGRYAGAAPQTPIHWNGKTYLTNAYNSAPVSGANSAGIWILENGQVRPVAACGNLKDSANNLLPAFAGDQWKTLLPPLADQTAALFAWSDRNGNSHVDTDEVSFLRPAHPTFQSQTLVDCVSVLPDLSFAVAAAGDQALLFAPRGFTATGVPLFDAAKGKVLTSGVQRRVTTGGGQVLVGRDGWTVLTTAPAPYAPQGFGGVQNGIPMWSYPSLWPGLHASHNAPLPEFPGEVIGSTRLLGNTIEPKGSDAGEIWAINGNDGNVYLLTTDGLFVATLFKEYRTKSWSFPQAIGNMPVDDASLGPESFWPTITQTAQGGIYLQGNGNIVRLEGLEGIRRLPTSALTLTPAALQSAGAYFVQQEAARQTVKPVGDLTIALRQTPPKVDGLFDDWPKTNWVPVDTRTIQVGNWGHIKAVSEATLAIAGDKLYAAFRVDDPALLNNSGESLPNLFKTGGALDIMLDARPGGERLLVTRVKGKTTAVLYRVHVPGTTTPPVGFTSPLRTVNFDRVDDVSDQVQLASSIETDDKKSVSVGRYELSVPLATLGLTAAGQNLKGDIGILRGNGFQTLQRVYWKNKATGLVSDVPSEAELLPQLWGNWKIVTAP